MRGKYTLSNFYKSKEWVKLVNSIRLQRVDEHGDILCSYCHEPIARAYDCIGHHVIELDEHNVNDAMIALNPDNISLVHHKCHNRIHHKFRYDESMRQVFLVYGSPLAGKSTWVRSVQNDGDLIVDMGNIWNCISGNDNKPAVLNACVFGVRDYLLDCVRYRRGKWRNAYVIGGYPIIGERERLCKELGAREIFIDTSKEECLNRLIQTKGSRENDMVKYIDDWWEKYSPPERL